MSFSLEVKKEFAEIKNKKSCCKKSFLLGLLIDSKCKENGDIELSVSGNEICEIVIDTITAAHKGDIQTIYEPVMGLDIYTVKFNSPILSSSLREIMSADPNEGIFKNPKCTNENCLKSFLRGAFITSGTLNEPQKGYHLEFKLKNMSSAAFLYKTLSGVGFDPKIANRRSGRSIGIYYKNSSSIEDLLTYLGAVKCIFDFINVKIEREIRNSVNRGTNCVAGNISKSVKAAQKQVSAISQLNESGKLSLLPDELYETARLRLCNPSMSLSELALKHNPPISKSGLTHRLAKIIDFAEDIND